MENILVSIRVRPLGKQEAAKGTPWKLTPRSIALSSGVSPSVQTYNFDRVFDPNSKTVDIYDAHTKKIISSAVQGFNGTIFAYGQTSSGKTYTMRGTPEEPGIIPLAIQDVFRNIVLAQNREFLLRVSYMEIYNEEIKDLLAPENCKLQIHENFERGIFVAGLREEIVVSPEQVLVVMDFGEGYLTSAYCAGHRHVGETNMNVHSSRSHAIFRMVIESRDRSQDQDDPEYRAVLQNSDPVRVSHLNLVDLAGSERVAKTGAEGARLKEGTHINKSLMTLGNVINKLSEGIEKQGGHVPYRDSKLTRILQPALGGNARTVIICNITPSLVHVDETKGTLHFASRANRVTNCAQVNEIVTDAALLKRQKKEIAELRQKLQNQESPSEYFEEEILNLRNELLKTELERERMALELLESQKVQAEREHRIKEQQQKIENLSTMVINSAVDDREFEKRSKRNNRRETWCARPQSGLPLLPDLQRPCQKDVPKTPKAALSELAIQIGRERSFGLPPPFEALMEEDEDMFTRVTSSPFDDGFHERLGIDDGFTLPEPGPQSSVADRRKRSSDDWIVGTELEQQLLDLQVQYDTLQCDHVIKMNESNSEIDRLKRELAYTQLSLGKDGKKENYKKVQDSERRGKSLDGRKETVCMAMIEQLRAQVHLSKSDSTITSSLSTNQASLLNKMQVGKLETEKLYMERELQRLSGQARVQTEISTQELEEVYGELNLANSTLSKLNSQLDMTLQDVQQLQNRFCRFDGRKSTISQYGIRCKRMMEKRENEVLYLQLSFHLKDLRTELDDIKEPYGGLQSTMIESLQHLTIYVKSLQECLADARALSALRHVVHEKNNVKLLWLTSKAGSLEDYNSPAQLSTELDETYGCDKVKKTSSEDVRIFPDQHGMNPDEDNIARQGVQSLPWNLEDKLYQSDDDKESQVHESGRTTQSEKKEEIQSGDHKKCDIKHYSASVEQKPITSIDFNMLQEERDILRSAVDSRHMQIDHVFLEKQSLLLRQTGLQDELANLKACLQGIEDEQSSLSETNLQEKRSTILAAVDSLHKQIEYAYSEKQSLLLRKATLQEELDNLKACLQVMEDEKRILSKTNQNPEGISIEYEPGQSPNGLEFPEFAGVGHEYVADLRVSGDESLTSLEAELSKLKEENSRLSASLASAHSESERAAGDQQTSALQESCLVDKIESFKVALQSVVEERNKYKKVSDEVAEGLGRLELAVEKLANKLAAGFENFDRHYEISELSGANDTMCIIDGEVDWAIDELKSICECVETFLIAVKQAASEDGRLLLRESALSEEMHHARLCLQSLENEKNSLTKRLHETQSKLEGRRSDIRTIVSQIRSSPSSIDVTEAHEELSALEPEIETLVEEKRTVEDRVDVLHTYVLHSQKDIDILSSREPSLEEEVTSFKSFLEEVEDDRKLWMKVSEERLADVERQKEELEDTGRILLSTTKDHANAQKRISDLILALSQKLDEVDRLNQGLKAEEEEGGRLNKRLKDVEEEKKTLTMTVVELDSQLQAFRAGAAEALKEMEGWQRRYQTESTHYRADIASLRKELSAAKALPGALLKERDSLHRDLEKTKFKMKDTEAKLKTTIQDRSKLETEKANMERELRHLRQSTLLQRDISRRDSIVDQRRQSIALGVNKTRNQLNSVEHALQLKTEEVENLTYELSRSHENYAKIEFAMAEAESYSNEKVIQLEGDLAILKDEKDAGFASLDRLQNDVDPANEQYKAKSNELENLRNELVTLVCAPEWTDGTDKLQESERERTAAKALVTAVIKEKEDIVEELLDAHISFQRQKAELIGQAQENREKCNILNQDIVLLGEELHKLKELQQEASDANGLLQSNLQQALETNTEKSLTQHELLKDLEADVESYKEQCRELQQCLESFQGQEYDLRLSGSDQLEQLRLDLQQCTLKLSIARDEEHVLSMENRSLLVANTKLQFALDATTDRLEIFENRLDESDWELTEFKSLLQKAGFIRGDEWNLVSLQQFEKHIKAQNNEAKRLETELASKKIEMIHLEVQFESTRAQFQKYEEEIQYLKTRVLTPEQETGVREIVQQNKRLQAQIKKVEEKTGVGVFDQLCLWFTWPWQELHEVLKGKEVSLFALQTTVGSIYEQNAKLQKDLDASKVELESVHQLHKIAMQAGAIGKSSMSSSKAVRPGKLQPQATSETSTSLPFNLFQNSGSTTFRAESTCTESSVPGYRMPLGEKPSHDSPCIAKRKQARLFPALERSKLSRSLGLGPRFFTFPQSHPHSDLNKENFTLH